MDTSIFTLLSQNPIFQNLDKYALQLIEPHLQFRSLEADEVLFHEGDHGDFVAFVLLGQLAVCKFNRSQQPVILAHKQSGDSIGDMALIDALSRSATVQATQKTALILLPKPEFDKILLDHPRIGIEMLKGIAITLSLNLRRTSESYARLSTQSFTQAAVSTDTDNS